MTRPSETLERFLREITARLDLDRIVEREGVTPDVATRRVEETNKRREQYVRRYWHRSWLAPENYHLCVNTDWLGIDGAARLIVRVVEERLV